jgi:hypothetical protein
MTSAERIHLEQNLRRHPQIEQHVSPAWRLKRLTPPELIELARKLGLAPAPEVSPPGGVDHSKARVEPLAGSAPSGGETISTASQLSRRAVGDSPATDTKHIFVIAMNSESEIRRRRAAENVEWPLRDLTANLIRVVRGAGKPYAIRDQLAAVLTAMSDYRDAAGRWPSSDELANMVAMQRPQWLETTSSEIRAEDWAKSRIIRGALQMTASELLGQRTQEAAGESEMYDGINQIEDLRTKRRAEWAAQTSSRSSLPKRKPRKPGG